MIFALPLLKELARRYAHTPAQIMLRWMLPRDIIVILQSSHKERLQENMPIFDFNPSAEDMGRIAALDTGRSTIVDVHDLKVTRMPGTMTIHRRCCQ